MNTSSIPTKPLRAVLMQRLKQRLKPYTPAWLLKYHHDRTIRKDRALYQGKALREVFSHVYETGGWGVAKDHSGFYSGSSSHDPAIVDTYVEAVTAYLGSLPYRPDVVDLGCGDFNVGSRIRPACARYVACDVVEAVIQSNRTRFFSSLDVDFRCLDITSEPWPRGDVVFLRQVLDHLDNARIAGVLASLTPYKSLILTEYLPLTDFPPNLDKPIGPGLRIWGAIPSGIVLTEPPFELKALSTRILCEVQDNVGVIRTIAYELPRQT